ncbi:MAG: glycosyltransferase [Bacilli bacterium]
MKILEVNNIDTIGRRFNGYDLMEYLNEDKNIIAKQIVLHKCSENNNVLGLAKLGEIEFVNRTSAQEDSILSTHSQVSLTTPMLLKNKFYQETDIIHFHMFHNSRFSLYSLLEIYKNKKIVISLHDPWFVTGRCVHPFECEKWKSGCNNCKNLGTLFPMRYDNCHSLWELKKNIFANIKVDLIVNSRYMENLVKNSQILQNQTTHFIPFGIDTNHFKASKNSLKLRKKYKIDNDNVVLFLRAQEAFKGTEYILKALEEIKTDLKITILTCEQKGMFKSVKGRYQILDLGVIDSDTMLEAYQLSDIFLMPSIGESFGFMAIEAMACEKPVVVFDNSALPSVTFTPECGVLVENKNYHALADAISMLINDKEERQRRGELGRKLVLEHYDINKYNNAMKDMYSEINARKDKKIENHYPKINKEKDLEVLKRKLICMNRSLITCHTKEFDFLKTNRTYYKNRKYIIDYSNYEVQELLKKYNNTLAKFTSLGEKRHPLKTAINLVLYDQKKLFKILKEKLGKR